jgi:hypothetical protein
MDLSNETGFSNRDPYFLIFSGLWQLVVSFWALGGLTELWEITIFDAMLVYRRVNPIVYIYIKYIPMKSHEIH